MSDHKHSHKNKRRKKPLWRRVLARLGIRHVTFKMVIFYVCTLVIMLALVPFIIKFANEYILYFVKSTYSPKGSSIGELLRRSGP